MRAKNPFAGREHLMPGNAMERALHAARMRAENPMAGYEPLVRLAAAPAVQAKPQNGAPAPSASPASVQQRLGEGEAMAPEVTSRFSRAYGRNLSDVRLHRDSPAASAVGARAVTVGRDVAFAPGEYRPGTPGGDRLIGHELAHVVQQAGGARTVQGSGLGEDGYEQEADRAAETALGGGRMVGLSPVRGSAVQRTPAGQGGAGGAPIAPEPQREQGGGSQRLAAAEYIDAFAGEIECGVSAIVPGAPFTTHSPFATWAGDPATFGRAVMASMGLSGAGGWIAAMRPLLAPEILENLVDRARPRDVVMQAPEDQPDRAEAWETNEGEPLWFPDVAVEIGNALVRQLSQSLARIMPRYVAARHRALGRAEQAASASLKRPLSPPRRTSSRHTPSTYTPSPCSPPEAS